MQRWTVKDVMTHNVVSVTEETSYKEIVQTLAQKLVSAVPVVDDGMVVPGIVSDADLLHKMQFSGLEPHVPVGAQAEAHRAYQGVGGYRP